MKKYVSYSELNLWERDREEYVNRYVKGVEIPPNLAMRTGTMVHQTIENPLYPWVKEAKELGFRGKKMLNLRKAMSKVLATRAPESSVIMTAKLDDDVDLFIEMDGFWRKERELDEYKTTAASHWWPWQIHNNFQIDFYALTYYLRMHQFFREIRLREVDYGKGNMKTHKTTRSMRDNKITEERIRSDVSDMKKAGIWNLRLSRKDRNQLNQGRLL